MGKERNQSEEEVAGCPDWMVTFCDCMTLLLTFFVLLLSFATFHKETLPQLGRSFAQALPTIGVRIGEKRESLYKRLDTNEQTKQNEGSETPTTVQKDTRNFMREKRPLDFRNLKVFTIPSESFFYGRGAAVSVDGKQTLDALATFLTHQTGRVVISENGPDGNTELGLTRAAAVMDYLVGKGISKQRFSLTDQTTTRQKSSHRQLEITLLDRSVYE